MDKFQALQSFWGSFGIPAYDESTVPTGENKPAMPYITYDAVVGNLGDRCAMSASIWYRGTSWSEATTKLTEIASALNRSGKVIPMDEGAVWIKAGSPFAQRMPDSDDTVRRIYINVTAEYITSR